MSLVLDLFLKGKRAQLDKGVAEEATKAGTLRAGNTGILLRDEPVGSCPRRALLRMEGVEVEPTDETKDLMFDQGRSNEDLWCATLMAAAEPSLSLRREEEVRISWRTKNGVEVSGRPDIVLGRDASRPLSGDAQLFHERIGSNLAGSTYETCWVPVVGVELKQVFSLWTARDVLFKGKPKLANLMQAGHYSWKLGEQHGRPEGLPYELWYTNRSTFAITDYSQDRFFAKKNFPKEGEPLSQYCRYNPKGQILSVEPFIVGYEVKWTSKGQLIYRQVGADVNVPWTHTIITRDGIEKYYEQVANAKRLSHLPPRPVNLEANGEKGGYDICNYCPMEPVCSAHEGKGLEKWMSEVKQSIKK